MREKKLDVLCARCVSKGINALVARGISLMTEARKYAEPNQVSRYPHVQARSLSQAGTLDAFLAELGL